MARKKKEFTAESGLGFMRLIQVYNVFYILCALFSMLFMTGYKLEFSFSIFDMLFCVIAMAVTMWLIGCRKERTREIVPALIIFEYINALIIMGVDGSLSLPLAILDAIPGALTIVYFRTSRRAKAVLVRPFSDVSLEKVQAGQNKKMWDLKSRDFWLRMLIYFFIFSVVGHWMEAGFCMLVKMGIAPGNVAPDDSVQFRDALNPFYIYGIAFVMCGLLLYPIKEYFLKKCAGKTWLAALGSYLVNFVFVGIVEYVLGVICNQSYTVWDYRNQPFNINGQVCLVYTLLFAVAATVVTWLLFPLFEHLFSYIKRDAFYMVFVIALALFLILVFTYNITLDDPDVTQELVDLGYQRS